MHNCIICSNSSIGVKRRITFHRFPKALIRKQKWLESLNLTNVLDWQRVCSEHFSDDDFKSNTICRRTLLKSAVPKLLRLSSKLTKNTKVKNTSFTKTNHDSAALSVVYPEIEYQNEQTPVNNQIQVENLTEMSENINAPRRSSRVIKLKKLDSGFVHESPTKLQAKKKIKEYTIVKNSSTKELSFAIKLKTKVFFRSCKCIIKTCSNKNLSFFGFPKNSVMRSIWIKNCGLEGIVKPRGKLKSTVKICAIHFKNSMFSNPPKNNRLKPEAIPTIFCNNDVNNILPIHPGNEVDGLESQAEEELKSTPDNTEPSTLKDTMQVADNFSTPNDIVNMSYVPESNSNIINNENNEPPPAVLICNSGNPTFLLKFSNNLSWKCPIPRCSNDNITNSENNNTSPRFLFSPMNDKHAKHWSSIFHMEIDTTTTICEKHFNFDKNPIYWSGSIFQTKDEQEEISLEVNSMSKEIKVYKASKRPIDNNKNENLIVKKIKNNLNGKSKNTTKHIDLPENEDIEYSIQPNINQNSEAVDSLSKNAGSIQNTSPSNFEVLPEIVDNNSLAFTMPKGIEQCKPALAIASTFSISSIEVLNPSALGKTTDLSLNKMPSTYKAINSASIALEPNASRNSPTTLTHDSMSITLGTSNRQSDQVSAIDSTNMIDSTDNLNHQKIAQKSEPFNSQMSNHDSIVGSPRIVYEEPSLTEANHNQQILKTDDIQIADSYSIDVIKSELLDENSTTSFDDYYSSNDFEQLPLRTTTISSTNFNTSLNNSELICSNNVTTIRTHTQLSSDNYPNEVLESSVSSPVSRTTSILPTTSVDHLIKEIGSSKLKILLSHNSSESITLQPSSENKSTTSANSPMGYTSQPHCIQNEQQSATTSKGLDQSSSSMYIHKNVPYNQNSYSTSVCKKKPVITNYVSNPNNNNPTKKEQFIPKIQLIYDIAKSVKLPSNLWKKTISKEKNEILFDELNQFGAITKRVYFKNSLVPDININDKYYEYIETIKTKNKLEELLEKIDDIDICFGYHGQYHKNCIGYFEDNIEETETCHNCASLFTMNIPVMKKKSSIIKRLQNKIFILENRVSQARLNLQKLINNDI